MSRRTKSVSEFPFRIGFANLRHISYEADSLKHDLGGSGLATVVASGKCPLLCDWLGRSK